MHSSRLIAPPDTPEPLPPMNSSAPLSPSIEAGEQENYVLYFELNKLFLGKLGLLPKRPVSLLRDPATSSSPPAVSQLQPDRQLSEDGDGLEYTENPFEETEKKR